ncbi:unnamed protein product [Mortierella alpina]
MLSGMESARLALFSREPYTYKSSPSESATSWLEKCRVFCAAEVRNPQAVLARVRLEQAYACQELHYERVHEALRSLSNKDLILAADKTSSLLAYSIASDILNCKGLHSPPTFTIDIAGLSQKCIVSIPVPSRSHLLLSFIASSLTVNSYLFFSRSLPVLFKHDNLAPWLGLFHHNDPILEVSDFLVLTPSASGQTTIDLPIASSLSAVPFASEQTCATFRRHARMVAHCGKRKGDELKNKDVVMAFKKSCRETIWTWIRTPLTKNKDKEEVHQHFDAVWTEKENVQRDSRAKKKGAKNEKRGEMAESAGDAGDVGDDGEEGDGDDSDADEGSGNDPRNASKDQYQRQKHVHAILETLVVFKRQEPVIHPRAARIIELGSHDTTGNTTSTNNAAASETSLVSIPDSNASLTEEEAQIATDWNVDGLEDLGLSAKDLDDFEFEDPFDPDKAHEDEDGSEEKEPSRATMNSLQVLTRTLLESPFIYGDIDGYPEFTRILSFQVTPSSSQTLLLNARVLYESLCSQEALRFDIRDKNGLPVAVANDATRHKAAVFASFFDIAKIEGMCRAHVPRFAHRISCVDQFTIRIMGEVILEVPDRGERPVSSTFEKRKKAKQAGQSFDWNEEARVPALGPAPINLELDGLETEIKKPEAYDKELRKTLRDKLTTLSAYSLKHRRLSRTDQTHQQEYDMCSVRKAAYRNLQAARAEVCQTQGLAEAIQASLR